MRCLYCNKELALFKKLTGAGEFCSEAHRDKYQDEYNRLALSRLLQAQKPADDTKPKPLLWTPPPNLNTPPPVEKALPAGSARLALPAVPEPPALSTGAPFDLGPSKPSFAEPVVPEPVVLKPIGLEPIVREPIAREPIVPVPIAEKRPDQEPEMLMLRAPEPVREAPAVAGFLSYRPAPAAARAALVGSAEPAWGRKPPLPEFPRSGFADHLCLAGAETMNSMSVTAAGSTANWMHGDAQPDDFSLASPTVTGGSVLKPSGWNFAKDPMEILIFPKPPHGSPAPWLEPEKRFQPGSPKFAEFLRLQFTTTGFEGTGESGSLPASSIPEGFDLGLIPTPPPTPAEPVRAAPPKVEPAEWPHVSKDLGRLNLWVRETPDAVPAEGIAPVGPVEVLAEPEQSRPVSALHPETGAVQSRLSEREAESGLSTRLMSASMLLESEGPRPETVPVAALDNPLEGFSLEERQQPLREIETVQAPEIAVRPLPFTLLAIAPSKGKPVAPIHSQPLGDNVAAQGPRIEALPVRPAMILAPAEPKSTDHAQPAEAELAISTKPEPAKAEAAKHEPTKSEQKKTKWEKRSRKLELKLSEPKAEIKQEADSELPHANAKAVDEPKQHPAADSETGKEPAASGKPAAIPASGAKESTEKSPLEDGGDARKQKNASKPPASPLALPTPDPSDAPTLNLRTEGGFWSRIPKAAKIGAIAAALGVIGLIGALTSGGSSGKAASVAPRIVEAGPALLATEGGWSSDWGQDAASRRIRQVSVFRPSLPLSDYRLELQGMIESKSLGWVIRAKDPKNFYVMKLEIVKPGLTPAVALVRFAVLDGEEQPRSQFPLSIQARLDTLYKIRVDAVGGKFTTWVQGQKVDEWTDERIKSGGVGLFNERAERGQLKGVAVTPLTVKN